MSYSTVNSTAVINGAKGPYDNKVNNESVKYGRNAAANYKEYTDNFSLAPLDKDTFNFSNISKMSKEEFDTKMEAATAALDKPLPPLAFAYKYLPESKIDQNNINKMALLGAAFEEMGKKVSVSVADFTKKLQDTFGDRVTAEVFDVNKDSQIDVAEYSTSILMSDMLSSEDGKLDAGNISGEITEKGLDNLPAYTNKKNIDVVSNIVSSIYGHFGLEAAKTEFITDANNIK